MRRLVPGLVLVLAATSAGCSGDAEPEPSTSSSSPTASEPSEPSEAPDDGASEAAGRQPRRREAVRRGPEPAGRGPGLPRRRRPRRRRAALRPRPLLGPGHLHPRRDRGGDLPGDRGRGRRTARPVPRDGALDGDAGRREGRHRPAGQEPRRPLRGRGRPALHALAGVRRHPGPGRGADLAGRRAGAGLDDHARRLGVDDAGAVRRLHLVRRERPAGRQGALRLHACARHGR